MVAIAAIVYKCFGIFIWELIEIILEINEDFYIFTEDFFEAFKDSFFDEDFWWNVCLCEVFLELFDSCSFGFGDATIFV